MKSLYRKIKGNKKHEQWDALKDNSAQGYLQLAPNPPSQSASAEQQSQSPLAPPPIPQSQSHSQSQNIGPPGESQPQPIVLRPASPSHRAPPAPLTEPTSDALPAPQDASRPVSQNQDLAPPPPLTQNQDVPLPLAPALSDTNSPSSVPPMEDIRRLLRQPATTATDKQKYTFRFKPRALCPVCYNLDPYQAPPNVSWDKKSWAQIEYIIPEKTPASEIEVYSPEKLREAAKKGCLYCTIVAATLAAVHPGWETKETFPFIFLAAGAPAIVRLNFGKTAIWAMTREQASGFLGLDIPEGPDMEFVVAAGEGETPKRPIEVEIYRPIIPDDQLTIGDIALTPLVENLGFAEEISPHSGDQQCFNFIKQNIATCIKHHQCGIGGALPLLPDRILWIESNGMARIKLLEPKNIRAPYIALSYCWGPLSPNTYLTNSRTLNARKAGIEFSDLPRLFQDVIQTARALEIEYVWIDRLCIIQGDNKDFKLQAHKMDGIYGNATLTIAAASAINENDPILSPRDKEFKSYDMSVDSGGIGSVKLRCRRLSPALRTEDSGGDYGRMSTRAWIWQERLLAARTVFFTPTALKFECHVHSIWEGFNKDRAGHSWSSQIDNMTHDSWTRLVEEFTSRNITRPSDRLVAMNAVMMRVSESTGWSPFWGLWTDSFIEDLCWASKSGGKGENHTCRMNPGHYAPTWSWASVDGPVQYSIPIKELDENNPNIGDLECQSLDKASGLIKVSGHVIFAKLHVTVKPNESHENDSTEHQKFLYEYKVKGQNQEDEDGFPVTPDVPLKPWSGNIMGKSLSTAIRVPYGEKPPEQSWTADCLCVLVAKKKMQCDVLVLGLSMKVDFVWERIGRASRIIPATFLSTKRIPIEIL